MRAKARTLPPSPPLPAPLQTALLWRWPFWFLETLRARYGDTFTVRALAKPPLVFLSDPDKAKALFGASPAMLRPGKGGTPIEPIVGEHSFMLADGDCHMTGRTMLGGQFSASAALRHAGTVREIAEREIATWPRDRPIGLHDRLRA